MYFRKMILLKIITSPLALIYWLVASSRNALFRWGLLQQYKSSIPVISIGNLCMGGSGKTPHVALILEQLYSTNTAVISRGYGRKTKVLIEGNSKVHTSKDIGDEPMELLKKFEGPTFKMIIDGNRKNGLKYLEQQPKKTKLVVLDDGFQHQYVKRDLNILLTDFNQPFYNDCILPTGQLREPKKEAQRADLIMVTKCPEEIPIKLKNEFKQHIALYSSAKIVFTKITYQGFENKLNGTITTEGNRKFLLVTSIANPKPIYEHLNEKKIHYSPKRYRDHHNFTKKEIEDILTQSRQFDGIITTEKDWMRLKETALVNAISLDILILKIKIEFIDSKDQIQFKEHISALIN